MGLLDKLKIRVGGKKKATIYASKRSGLEKLCDVEYSSEEELMNDISSCLEQVRQQGYPIEKVRTLAIVGERGFTTSIANPLYQGKASSGSRREQGGKSGSLQAELLEQTVGNMVNMFTSALSTIASAYSKIGEASMTAISNVTARIVESSILSSKKIRSVIESTVEEAERAEKGASGFRVLSDVAVIAGFLMDVAREPEKYKKVFEMLKSSGGGEAK
jgi:hypothetical protein